MLDFIGVNFHLITQKQGHSLTRMEQRCHPNNSSIFSTSIAFHSSQNFLKSSISSESSCGIIACFKIPTFVHRSLIINEPHISFLLLLLLTSCKCKLGSRIHIPRHLFQSSMSSCIDVIAYKSIYGSKRIIKVRFDVLRK